VAPLDGDPAQVNTVRSRSPTSTWDEAGEVYRRLAAASPAAFEPDLAAS